MGGSLTKLEPGKGYMYESAGTEERTFYFPTIAKTAPKNVQPTAMGKIAVANKGKVTSHVEVAPQSAPLKSTKGMLSDYFNKKK